MKKIVVVDDNPSSRKLIHELLESPDHTIMEAADGQRALEIILAGGADLVLLDIQLPGLDGYSVIRRLRQDSRLAKLKVMAVTAFAMQGDRERALAAGFDEYITKPIDTFLFEAQVQELLNDEWL
jgi:CheY-like chemotaxis protein